MKGHRTYLNSDPCLPGSTLGWPARFHSKGDSPCPEQSSSSKPSAPTVSPTSIAKSNELLRGRLKRFFDDLREGSR